MTPGSTRLAAVVALVLNAFVWGLSWWPFRQLDALGLHVLWCTVIVYVVCAATLVAWRPASLLDVLREPGMWLVAAAAGVTNALFNWGVTIGEVVRVVLLFYLMPVWAVLLARLLLREPVTVSALARIALALGGAAIVLWPERGGWPVPRSLGDWLGIGGGFAFALTNVVLRREAHLPDTTRALAMFLGAIGVPGVLALVLATSGAIDWPPPPEADWLVGAVALALAFLVGNLALQYGAARLPATVTAVVLITEVPFASASAVLLGAETLTPAKVTGGALIVLAALLAARPATKRRTG